MMMMMNGDDDDDDDMTTMMTMMMMMTTTTTNDEFEPFLHAAVLSSSAQQGKRLKPGGRDGDAPAK